MRGLIFVFSFQLGISVASAQQAATATAGGAKASVTFVAPASGPNCAAQTTVPLGAAMPAMERGFSRAVTRVGSPLASLRHRLAQRALIRAQARAAAAEAAASRVHVFSVLHGPQAGVGIQGSGVREETAEPSCAVDQLPTPVKE